MTSVGRHVIIFGGRSGKSRIGELRVVDTRTWAVTAPALPDCPASRCAQACALLPHPQSNCAFTAAVKVKGASGLGAGLPPSLSEFTHALVMCGGYSEARTWLDDVHVLRIGNVQYPAGSPPDVPLTSTAAAAAAAAAAGAAGGGRPTGVGATASPQAQQHQHQHQQQHQQQAKHAQKRQYEDSPAAGAAAAAKHQDAPTDGGGAPTSRQLFVEKPTGTSGVAAAVAAAVEGTHRSPDRAGAANGRSSPKRIRAQEPSAPAAQADIARQGLGDTLYRLQQHKGLDAATFGGLGALGAASNIADIAVMHEKLRQAQDENRLLREAMLAEHGALRATVDALRLEMSRMQRTCAPCPSVCSCVSHTLCDVRVSECSGRWRWRWQRRRQRRRRTPAVVLWWRQLCRWPAVGVWWHGRLDVAT